VCLADDNGIQYHVIHEVRWMYVCCCNVVTDREVADAIEAGARTRSEVTRACGAGGDCGACHATIDGMIEAHGEERDATRLCGIAKGEEAVEALVPAAALVRGRAA
jgi:bacterioferritin-associated ferredoxin